jgi:hypothetical protein
MTNIYRGLGPDEMPTAPYKVTGAGSGPGGGWRHRRRVAVLVLTTVVAGGGAFAVAEAATSSPAAPTVATQTAASTQAAVLNNVLRGHTGLARLRRLGGMYGQFTFKESKEDRTVAFERGTVTAVTGSDVVVRANDGTTWTWALTGSSVVREDGKRTKASALATGEPVFAGGTVTGGTRSARLIVIRKAAAKGTA